MAQTPVMFPPGRLVMGSLYKSREKDAEGKPLTIKSGPNAGQPRTEYSFLVAIPKKPGEQAWYQTEWGAKLVGVGQAAFPQQYNTPTFAWKVKDGDSQIPNRRGRKPCDNEGWKGHWVVAFSSSYVPRIYKQENGRWAPWVDVDAVKPGYWVQVQGDVAGNNSTQQPGIYINHGMVAFQGYDTEIVSGPDANEAGFNAAPLPGVSTTPVGGAMPVTGGMPSVPGMGAPAIPGGMPAMPGAPVAAAPTVVVPNPGFAAGPAMGAPSVPGLPAAPTPPVARQMTALAQGRTYEMFVQAGWNDAQMIQGGYLLP